MPTFKVFGDKVHQYYTVVTSDNPDEAYDKASGDYVEWFELETDDTIEPHTVELQEDLVTTK